MTDNLVKYGFRWSVRYNGAPIPTGIECIVATGQNFVVSAANYDLNIGDPVKRVNTGGINLADPGDAIYGVVVAVLPYFDGAVMKPSRKLPSGVSYGTNLARQSKVIVVPAYMGLWEVDVDDNSTATTLAGYQALIGENADHSYTANATSLRVFPKLDISTHATTSAQWRIHRILDDVNNQDFSGANVKVLVSVNETSEGPAYTATGV